MPPKGSDRGREVSHSLKSTTKRHMSDVPGAKGCYYCWIGEYNKCDAACSLVHKTNASHSGLSSSGAKYDVDAFDQATPYFTSMHKQLTSVFDETDEARKIMAKFERKVAEQEALERSIAAEDSPSFTPGERAGASPMAAAYDNRALYDKRSAASKRHPTVRSFHEPQISVTPYKHPRGAMTIQLTPFTVVSVTPATHAYSAHHKDTLNSGDSIWTGRLVKEGRVAADPRSQAVAASMLAGKRATSPSASSRSAVSSSSRVDATASQTPSRQRYAVEQDHIASYILSGGYRNSMSLPLPAVFDPIVNR